MLLADRYPEFYFIGQIETISRRYQKRCHSAEDAMRQVRGELSELDRKRRILKQQVVSR